jgi:metal-responsive CopG/Arc/MetJ family transcriptional regulator
MVSSEIVEKPKQYRNNAVIVRFKRTTIAELDELVERKGFRNRQDLIREAVRKYLEEASGANDQR